MGVGGTDKHELTEPLLPPDWACHGRSVALVCQAVPRTHLSLPEALSTRRKGCRNGPLVAAPSEGPGPGLGLGRSSPSSVGLTSGWPAVGRRTPASGLRWALYHAGNPRCGRRSFFVPYCVLIAIAVTVLPSSAPQSVLVHNPSC